MNSSQYYRPTLHKTLNFYFLGLDQYRAGARYSILLAAAIPILILIPIPGCTIFFVLKMRFCAG